MRKSNSLSGAAQDMPKTNRKPVPRDETKEQKFIRLATGRTTRIMKSIDALGNLSRLKPTEAQTEKVFNAIKSVLESAYGKWKGEKPEEKFAL